MKDILKDDLRETFEVPVKPWDAFGAYLRVKSLNQAMSMVFYVVCCASIGWLASQFLDRRLPSEVKWTPLAETVMQGERFPVQAEGVRWRLCSTQLRWTIMDGAHELRNFGPVPADPVSDKLGVLDPIIKKFDIPFDAAPGDAQLVIVRSVECPGNYAQGIRPIEQRFPPIRFKITPYDANAPKPKVYYQLGRKQ